ncbi:MAG TPA: CHAP domain-containing protein [Candidatus Saccharimonadales bacterium]|nr:CHAP domain-containing protein [Candidatus Saccharimonadales bacterium]
MDSVYDDWGELNRECTSFAAFRLSARNGFTMPFSDYAINWKSRAIAMGYTVDMNPKVGSIAWFSYGHVAWVEALSGSNVVLEEYNFDYAGHYNQRTIPASGVSGFIHFKDIGNGTMTPGIVRQSSSGLLWKISNNLNGGVSSRSFYYGASTDTPVVGDWGAL